ncbi:DUF6291 domain-containing protein [Chryseobacterium sp.]|uniref:DUF6291 domain-containing protein n=1 Tax=Chryseobacterium sp. TaxID=1871047 RepID=UPI00321AB478
MKDKDNGVIFLKDWLLLIDSLSDENKLVFWDYFTSYEFGEDRICENQFVAPTWNFIKKQLDNMRVKYQENVIDRNKKNGAKGGRPRKETQKTESVTVNLMEPSETEINPENPLGILETQKTPNNKDNVKDNSKDKDNVNYILLKKESKEENIIKESSEGLFDIPPKSEEKKASPKKQKKYFTKIDFKKKLIELGVEEEDADKWIEVRKQKRAVFTEDAIQLVVNECNEHNFSFSEAIKACRTYGWQGFKYEWYLNQQNSNNGKSNSNNANNGFNNKAGNTTGGVKVSGKTSARVFLARGIKGKASGNSESGDITIDAEIVE